MVATLGQMNEMTALAERSDMVAISPKPTAETLLKILGGVAMAARMAIGLVAHSVTGGVFLGDYARKMDREQGTAKDAQQPNGYHGTDHSTDDDSGRIDGYYSRGV